MIELEEPAREVVGDGVVHRRLHLDGAQGRGGTVGGLGTEYQEITESRVRELRVWLKQERVTARDM